jgi:hypothetical protein
LKGKKKGDSKESTKKKTDSAKESKPVAETKQKN